MVIFEELNIVINTPNLYDKVCEEICWNCGTAFEKPGSCEDCMDDEFMNHYRSHKYDDRKKELI